jgi:hypothetical protein
VACLLIQRFQVPVVEDQELNASKGALQPCIASVAVSKGKIAKQPRHALTKHGTIVAAGLVA